MLFAIKYDMLIVGSGALARLLIYHIIHTHNYTHVYPSISSAAKQRRKPSSERQSAMYNRARKKGIKVA